MPFPNSGHYKEVPLYISQCTLKYIPHYIIIFKVSTNGYFAMGITPTANAQNIDGPNSVVAPYGADIDTRVAGIVQYTHVIHNGTHLMDVSDFIEDEINVMGSSYSFTGTRMIVAEWNGVAQYNGNEVRCLDRHTHVFQIPCLVYVNTYIIHTHADIHIHTNRHTHTNTHT